MLLLGVSKAKQEDPLFHAINIKLPCSFWRWVEHGHSYTLVAGVVDHGAADVLVHEEEERETKAKAQGAQHS